MSDPTTQEVSTRKRKCQNDHENNERIKETDILEYSDVEDEYTSASENETSATSKGYILRVSIRCKELSDR
jgi:hypothetical protein